MTESENDKGERTQAAVRRTRWPGWIWAVPIAALGIVGGLLLRHFFAERGPEVTVTFKAAQGVKPDDTKVKYKGMVVGSVEDISLAKDLSHVVMKLRLHSDVEDGVRAGTRFWIAGTRPEITDLGSLRAIMLGPHIEMDPGPGEPARSFTGLEQPPQVMTGTPGIRLTLHTDSLGPIDSGSSVRYRGIAVGSVESSTLTKDGRGTEVTLFIRAPFDQFAHTGSRFWKDDGVQVLTDGRGIKAHISSLPALVSGAIAFDTPGAPFAGPQAKSGEHFTLYDDKDAARDAPLGPRVPFLVRFDGAVGELSKGAPVKLKGFRIGSVTDVSLHYDARSGEIRVPVTIEIEPARLGLDNIQTPRDEDWAPIVTEAIYRLVRKGLRARLDQSPSVIGAKLVVLDIDEHAQPAQLVVNGSKPEIPTVPANGIENIAAQAHAIMNKIDQVPIAQIGKDLGQTVHRIEMLSSSPEAKQSLEHLEHVLTNLDEVTRSASKDAGPLMRSLRKTADAAHQTVASADAVLGGSGNEQDRNLPEALQEISRAARAIRALADYLDRHPEALIAGKSGR